MSASEAERRRRTAVAGHAGDEDLARSALADDHPPVVATALGALARMGRLTAVDLDAALTSDSSVLRRRACELAADPSLDVDLLPRLADDDPLVAEMAAWSLGERGLTAGESAGAGVVGALAATCTGHPDPLVREAAVAALGALQDPAGLPAILEAVTDKPAVRRRAVLALAPFEGPEVDAALAVALTDRDWQVRQAAEDLTNDA